MEIDDRDVQERMAAVSPWKRRRREHWGPYRICLHSFRERFNTHTYANIDLDIESKRAALMVSPSVVSLVSLTGGKAFFMGSGTIIESVDVNGTYFSSILTSSSLLRKSVEIDAIPDDITIDVYLAGGQLFDGHISAHDFHLNVAVIKIKSDAALPVASLKFLDDSVSIDPRGIQDKGMDSKDFGLHPHSNLFKLLPGDTVVAVGRYFEEPHELMAAPGKFSLDCCNFDCKELFRSSCRISKCGIGGPLVNLYGEVIGVNFYDRLCTPFLPTNIASKCLEHFKQYGRFSRPQLGMEMSNLYAASLGQWEKNIQRFPNTFKGVLVEKVVEGSPAECAGLLDGDVIVQLAGNIVQSLLEFYGLIWDKVGESVEMVVIRTEIGSHLNLTMKVGETGPEDFNRWPLPDKCNVYVKRTR